MNCKFCGVGGLTWVLLGDKWRLEDRIGTIHRCIITKKLADKPQKKLNIKNDPLIEKALKKFKKELRGEGKIYHLKKY